jgi:hypothetical protein
MGTILNAETEEKDRLGRPKTIEVKVGKNQTIGFITYGIYPSPTAVDGIKNVYCRKALKFKHIYREIYSNKLMPYLVPDFFKIFVLFTTPSGFGGLGVACWPLVPKFAGSNPTEAVGFFRAKKSSARLPSEGK